jgi:hypothetical protein
MLGAREPRMPSDGSRRERLRTAFGGGAPRVRLRAAMRAGVVLAVAFGRVVLGAGSARCNTRERGTGS